MTTERVPSRVEELLVHREWVRRLAHRLVADESRADDLEQESWARALAHPPRHGGALRGWFGRVVRSVWIDTHRRESQRALRELAAARHEAVRPADVVAEADAHRRVVQAVQHLAEPYRTTLLLRYFEGLGVREIAARLGVPPETVKTRLRRAIESMRERLDAESGGERERWRAALLPIALSAGGTTMKASQVAAAAAVVVVMIASAAWWTMRGRGSPADAGLPETAAATGAATTSPADDAPPRRGPEPRRTPRQGRAAPAEPTPPAQAAPAVPTGAAPAPPVAEPTGTGPTGGPATPPGPAERVATQKSLGPTGETGAGTLRIVLADLGDRPFDGVKVQVYSAIGRAEARTDDVALNAGGEGERVGEVRGLLPGNAAVWVRAGNLFRSVMTSVVAGEGIEVRIRLPRGATVTGVVRHVGKGPLANAELTIGRIARMGGSPPPWTNDRLDANSDEVGRYRLEDVPVGTHVVSVSSRAMGYVPAARDPIVVTGPGDVVQDIVVGRIALEGVVRDATTKQPLPGARLSITTSEAFAAFAETDARGSYRMSDVPPGTHRLQVRHDGHVLSWFDATVADDLAPARRDFDLVPAAVLELRLTDATGQPYVGGFLLNHEVRGSGKGAALSGPFFTDENGVLRHEWIGPGPVSLSVVSPQGFQPWGKADADLVAGVNVVTIVVRPPVTSPDPTKGILVGSVSDASTGGPVPGARVRAQASNLTAVTDRQGRYRLEGITLGLPSARELTVSKDGYGFLRTTSEPLTPGRETTFHVTLERASVLSLRITDADGRAVAGQVVLSLKPRETGKGTNVSTGVTADASGHAAYRQIVPASYTVGVFAKDVGRASVDVEVGTGEVVLDVVLR